MENTPLGDERTVDTELLTPVEVAEMLRRPVGSLARWRQTGYGPPWARIGNLVRYRRADVERFIEEQFAASEIKR
jgi:hypothetical protein